MVLGDKAQEEQEIVEGGQDTRSNNGMTKPSAGKRSPNAGTSRKQSGTRTSAAKDGAGALDEEDFIRAFEDVSPVHVHSAKELEDAMNKIRDVLSDEKQDWEQRVAALKRLRGLVLGGAMQIDGFQQNLRLLENSLKLSVKDLRSQVVREACIATAYLSSLLKNKFDHMAEVLLQSLFNLVPNSARIMASSGVVTLRLVIRHTHASRLIPIITSNSTSKSVALRRRSFLCLEQLLQEWPTAPLERHGSTLSGAVKRGISDADSEARMVSRKCYWSLHNQLPSVARALYTSLEQSHQKALQNARGPANGVSLLPHSDRSSSSSQESLNRQFARRRMGAQATAAATPKKSGSPRKSAPTPGAMQRSRSDVDVGAASSAKARVSDFPDGPTSPAKSSGSNSNLSRLQRRPISTLLAKGEGRSRKPARMIHPSHRSRSSSPGSILTGSPIRSRGPHSPTMAIAALAAATPTRPRSKIPRSVGSSREASPTRGCSARGSHIPRPSLSQTCSRDTSRESSRDASPIRGFSSIVRYPSHIPRPSLSQGCSRNTSRDSSRDASPVRVYTTMGTRQHSRSTSALTSAGVFGLPDTYVLGQSRGLSSSVNAMRLLDSGSDVEAAVADALRRPVRRRYDMYGMGSDDDANSDASSACSERSHGSRNGPSPLYLRHTEDVAEILNRCSSSSWAERKEGLLGLQALFKGHRTLSRVELKRLCEIFTRMFGDPHSKVFSMFLETLVDFLQTHKSELNDWLFVLLTQLLRKMGADLLGSVHAKVQRALDVTRESFPTDLQFNILMRFVVDQTQVLNLKVKVAVLKYICSLTRQMELHEFVNASETRLAVSRIITWTTEPKSSEVRKAAQAVLVALFELNPSEFTMLLGALPKTFQDGATRLLHTHLKAPVKTNTMSSSGSLRGPIRSPASRGSPVTSPSASASSQCTSSPGEADGEPSEDFYRSLRGVSQAIQSFSFRSQEDLTDSGTSKQSTGEQTIKPPTLTEGPMFTPDSTGQSAAPPPITELLRVLSEGSARSEERRSALRELLKAAREEQAAAWEEHFKTALLLLLETLKDADGSVRSLTLRVLSEILRSQPACFRKYAELTIMKVLEAHRDPQKEVVRAAEETAGSLAASLTPEQSLKVLCPVVQTADFPINLAAIKMETRVVERLSPPILHTLLPSIIPGLLQGYDNAESSVRKACVFCLVAIHSAIGDELNPFLAHLSGSKIKLLNLYIKRAESSIPSSNAGLSGH